MMDIDSSEKTQQQCPHCLSRNILPHEEKPTSKNQDSMLIIFIAAALVIGGYFLILITSNLSFPLFLIGVIAISSWMIRRQDREKKKRIQKQKMFVCLDCNHNFPLWINL